MFVVLQENNARRLAACDCSHMDESPLLRRSDYLWRRVLFGEGESLLTWMVINGLCDYLRLTLPNCQFTGTSPCSLLTSLRPFTQIQSAHLVLRIKPRNTQTSKFVFTLKCDSENLIKDLGHSVKMEIFFFCVWEAWNIMASAEKFHSWDTAKFFAQHENGVRKFNCNPL